MSASPRTIDAVVIGGSAGAVTALGELLPQFPSDFPAVLVVVHVLPSTPSLLAELFAPRCKMHVFEAEAGMPVQRGNVYFAPSDYHLLLEKDGRCALSIEPPLHFSRPSIDVLFESAAYAYGNRLAAVVLTGASHDGAGGLAAVHAAGGLTFVQSPATAEASIMPQSAITAVPAARVLPIPRLSSALCALVNA